ncbi:MAG: type II toxin-antitoxin system RelE/ParE family toxin [Gemmataceae bacterium]
MNPVILTPQAEEEFEEAALWYESRAASLGTDFVARIQDKLDRIRTHPLLYPEVQDGIRRAGVQRFPYGIFYRILTDRIEVIAVFHSSRDPAEWQGRV